VNRRDIAPGDRISVKRPSEEFPHILQVVHATTSEGHSYTAILDEFGNTLAVRDEDEVTLVGKDNRPVDSPKITASLALSLGIKSAHWNETISNYDYESYTAQEAQDYFSSEAARILGDEWEVKTLNLRTTQDPAGLLRWEGNIRATKVVD
jgi:hypothetical protein